MAASERGSFCRKKKSHLLRKQGFRIPFPTSLVRFAYLVFVAFVDPIMSVIISHQLLSSTFPALLSRRQQATVASSRRALLSILDALNPSTSQNSCQIERKRHNTTRFVLKMSVSTTSVSNNNDNNNHNNKEDTALRVPPFVVDQRVFANDDESGSLYEAVIRKASWTGHYWTFLVHYLGWNARWDKWLDETKIHRDSPELRNKVLEQRDKKKRTRDEETASSSLSSSSRKKRVERGPTFAEYCELPFTLKTILVQDREKIMRLGFDAPRGLDHCNVENWRPARDVHHLPARVTVRTVLDHYVKMKKKEHAGGDDDEAREAENKARAFVEDLAKLFDETLPLSLLYQPERAQYLAIQAHPERSKKRKSEVYGCEFLLRFFVRLPVLLEEVNMGNRKEFGSQLTDLIVLLQKNRQACFKARYREPKDEELNDWEKALRDGAAPIAMDE